MSRIGMTFANAWQCAANAVSILLQLVFELPLWLTFSCCSSALMKDQTDQDLPPLEDWYWIDMDLHGLTPDWKVSGNSRLALYWRRACALTRFRPPSRLGTDPYRALVPRLSRQMSSVMAWDWHWIGQDWHWICWDWHRLDNWQTFVFVKNWPPISTGLAWIGPELALYLSRLA